MFPRRPTVPSLLGELGGRVNGRRTPYDFFQWKSFLLVRTAFEVLVLAGITMIPLSIVPEGLACIQLALKGQSFKYIVAEKGRSSLPPTSTPTRKSCEKDLLEV